ncbi:MAG: phosphoribulokinase, partial [Candidatus Methylomirabilales bacterium]
MSKKHPIIAVTGSSGAGTTTVKVAFEHIFYRLQVNPVIIEGDSFHRHNRAEMREVVAKAQAEGRTLSHFGAEANLFEELEELFRQYGQTGTGQHRSYVH